MVSNVVDVTETGDFETSRCVILVDLAFIAWRCVFIGKHGAVVNHDSTGDYGVKEEVRNAKYSERDR